MSRMTLCRRNDMMNYFSALLSLSVLSFGCNRPVEEKAVTSAVQNSGKLKAEVIEVKGSGLFEEKYFLQITNIADSTSYRIGRDLLEGCGGYESGIVQLKWLSDDKLFIERALDDRPQSLIYSVSKVSFEMVGDSLTTLFKKE